MFTNSTTSLDVMAEAVLDSGEWLPGQTNTYTLGFDPYKYILTVSGEVLAAHTGGTGSYSVTSDAPWKLQYSTDGGTNWADATANTSIEGWIQFDKVSATGSETPRTETVNVTVSVASGATTTAEEYHAGVLQSTPEKGTELAPYDLSMHTIYGEARAAGKPVTANSYVINASGWYAFPLVYGNAIKDGADNTGAYKNTGGELSTFTKADGTDMTSPYIEGASSAYPFWEDVPSYKIITNSATFCKLISASKALEMGLALGGTCGYVVFYVNKSTLQQGNAVIAVENSSGTILWSWHIWVTDENLTGQTGTANFHKGVLPVNLGWVDSGSLPLYEGKNLQIRFVQMKGDDVKNSVAKGPAREENVVVTEPSGQSPTWQWGRKDPFIRFKSFESGTSELESYSGTFIVLTSNSISLDYAIKNPTHFAQTYQKWSSVGGKYNNLWSAKTVNNKSTEGHTTAPVKTVYDPCPPGFQVPQGNAFNGFSTTGLTFSKGYDFLTATSGETIFFPATGYRNCDTGAISGVTSNGYYWTASGNHGNNNSKDATSFTLANGSTGNTVIYKTYGCSVRPVQETSGNY